MKNRDIIYKLHTYEIPEFLVFTRSVVSIYVLFLIADPESFASERTKKQRRRKSLSKDSTAGFVGCLRRMRNAWCRGRNK